jgi:hypothetical protein
MSFSPSKTAYTITYAALISHLRGMASSIRNSLADEHCPHDRAQAHRVLEVLLLGIRMADAEVVAPDAINALVDNRINEIQEERAPFLPVPASLEVENDEEEDVEIQEDMDADDELEEEKLPQYQPRSPANAASAKPHFNNYTPSSASSESPLSDLSAFRSPTSHTLRTSRISLAPRTPPTHRLQRRPSTTSLLSRRWADIHMLLDNDLESYTTTHASDPCHDLDYHETLRALNEAFEIAEQEPSDVDPDEFWSSVQDDIKGFKEIADAQRETRRPVSVVASDDEEEVGGMRVGGTPYNSSGRRIDEGWRPFTPLSPTLEMAPPAPMPNSPQVYDSGALYDVSEDEATKQLVRRVIERTLNEVLNASHSEEVQDVAQAY